METIFARAVDAKLNPIRIGFLTLPPMRARRKNSSLLANDNIGLRVVIDILRRSGFATAPCDVYTAQRFDVVIVAINSTYDIVSFLHCVRTLEWWRPRIRKFKVLVGGAGLTNPSALRNYADFALLGRADDILPELMDNILSGRSIAHDSVMCLPELHPVKMAQTQKLYPHAIGDWREVSIGCPNCCAFCLYRWSRKYIGKGDGYKNLMLAGESSPELMFMDLLKFDRKRGRVRCAIDGFSERIRYKFGKKISNDDICNVIEHVGSFGPTATVLTVYNICNFPGETTQDRTNFAKNIKKAKPNHRVIFVLHSTPFRPSNCTPMMWEPVDFTDRTDWRRKYIVERDDLLVVNSFSIESAWSHLLSVMIERAKPEMDGAIWHMLNINQQAKLSQKQKMSELRRTFPWEIEDCTRRYDVGSREHPAWMIRGAYSWDIVERIGDKFNHNLVEMAAR